MKEEIKNLINHANSILPNYQGVQTRYPEELKQIIATLVNHHKMNVKKIQALIPISSYSITQWSKQRNSPSPSKFKEIKITPLPKKRAYNKKAKKLNINWMLALLTSVLMLQVLMILLMLFPL